jgi:hypothetical protein
MKTAVGISNCGFLEIGDEAYIGGGGFLGEAFDAV